MTEIDWLSGDDAAAMLAYMDGKASGRKMRLFACACVRRFWHRLDWSRHTFCLHEDEDDTPPATGDVRPIPRRAVELAERLAEGQVSPEEAETFRQQAEYSAMVASSFDHYLYLAAAATLTEDPAEAARNVCENLRLQAVREALEEVTFSRDEVRVRNEATLIENRAQAAVLREMFGNPFRPSVIDPSWLAWSDGAVAAMAQIIQAEQRFEELPYLADALLDAGCEDEFLLRHLREPVSNHARGCWALEALLPPGLA